MNKGTKKLVLSAMFMALGLVLPFLTMQVPAIGQMLCPMHIPIFLCGIFCGWEYGLVVGAITPLLRGVLFGTPVLMPGGASMAFELAVYGAVIAIVYRKLPKRTWSVYAALLTSMIAGRIVWGLARMIIAGVTMTEFTFSAFIAGAITNAIPGIILQLVLIPPIVIGIERSGVVGEAAA